MKMGKTNRLIWAVGLLAIASTLDTWTGGLVKSSAWNATTATVRWCKSKPQDSLGTLGKQLYADLGRPELWTVSEDNQLRLGQIRMQLYDGNKDLSVCYRGELLSHDLLSEKECRVLRRQADQVVAYHAERQRERLAAAIAGTPPPAKDEAKKDDASTPLAMQLYRLLGYKSPD